MVQTATILARSSFIQSRAKTAHGLIRHGKKYQILSVLDETLVGQDAGEVIGLEKKDIPIVDELDTNAEVLIIGVAPSGGRLPPEWRNDIISAIKSGMDIVNGLHEFLNDDPQFVELANENKVQLIDVRKPPENLNVAQNIYPTVPVVLVCGTDACCGKRTTALELYHTALDHNYNAGFIATGQTGIMIGCDAGIAVDRLPPNFVAGAIESAVQDLIANGKEIMFVEGQGAILHHAYSTSMIGILHGAKPKFIIVNHPPLRNARSSFSWIAIPPVEEEIKALELLSPDSKVIALSLNCQGAENYSDICKEYRNRTGLLSVDVIADKSGAKKIFDKIKVELES
jgi:uncharacterized NAD-dependent epimerase/dehydratase family protein